MNAVRIIGLLAFIGFALCFAWLACYGVVTNAAGDSPRIGYQP